MYFFEYPEQVSEEVDKLDSPRQESMAASVLNHIAISERTTSEDFVAEGQSYVRASS